MRPNSSTQLSGASRPSQRQSRDYRGRNSFGASGDTAIGVATIPAPFPNGQARPNGMMAGSQQFDLARSPPSTASKSIGFPSCLRFSTDSSCAEQTPNTFPANSSDRALVKLGKRAPSYTRPMRPLRPLPANTLQRCVEQEKRLDSLNDANGSMKGNCKFGAKCALAHIRPDGRRVNRPSGPMAMNVNGGALHIGGRVNPPTYQHQDSALANSLLSQQPFPADPYSGRYQYLQSEANFTQESEGRYAPFPAESGLGSNSGSKCGSPTNDLQFPMSGVERRLTALDAPLPASFDSNGISHIARYGAVAASVPSKFGMESPPASLSQKAVCQPLDAVKALRSSAFPSHLRNSSQLGSSPPAVSIEDSSNQRKMHSQQNAKRPHLLSASVPRPGVSDDWDDGFPLEGDFLPTNLHDDVLTPQEKMRRLSRPEQDFGGFKHATQGGLGIPSGNSSKVGSPLASSPSRFSALFAKQRQESNHNNAGSGGGTATGFSHVGSPLRESHIQQHASDPSPFGDGITARPASSSGRSRSGLGGDQSPAFFSSPPRDSGSASNFGMNMISSQLQRSHLSSSSARRDPSDTAHVGSSSRMQLPTAAAASAASGVRHVSAPAAGAGGGGKFDRTISSPRISSTRIAEEREKEGEGDPLVFSMDDDTLRKNSSLWGACGKSPVITPLGEARNGVGVGAGAIAGAGNAENKEGEKGLASSGGVIGPENIYTPRRT